MSKKPDYTDSAENLCNPIGVKALLLELHKAQKTLSILECHRPAKLEKTIEHIQGRISDITASIKVAVDAQGSYQDLEAGAYAVKYRRMSKSYHVEPFKLRYPKYVPAVIEETINVAALEGLIKGDLLSEDALKHPEVGVITETPSYAYYIR